MSVDQPRSARCGAALPIMKKSRNFRTPYDEDSHLTRIFTAALFLY
jgi:hypothetical protein